MIDLNRLTQAISEANGLGSSDAISGYDKIPKGIASLEEGKEFDEDLLQARRQHLQERGVLEAIDNLIQEVAQIVDDTTAIKTKMSTDGTRITTRVQPIDTDSEQEANQRLQGRMALFNLNNEDTVNGVDILHDAHLLAVLADRIAINRQHITHLVAQKEAGERTFSTEHEHRTDLVTKMKEEGSEQAHTSLVRNFFEDLKQMQRAIRRTLTHRSS